MYVYDMIKWEHTDKLDLTKYCPLQYMYTVETTHNKTMSSAHI